MTRRFCVMTIGRTGAVSLMKCLESFDDIAVPNKNIKCEDNELINTWRYSEQLSRYAELCRKKITGKQELIEAFYTLNDGYAYAGFTSMPERHADYDTFIQRDDIQFIVLGRRDIPSLAASFLYSIVTGSWCRHAGPVQESWRFDAARDGDQIRHTVVYIYYQYAQLMRVPGAIRLYDEDLCNPDYFSGEMDAFFNRPVRLENRMALFNGADHISNWDEYREFVDQDWRVCIGQGRRAGVAGRPVAMNKPAGTQRLEQHPARSSTGRRIMYAWEMGMDLGHIMRFLPLAMRLRERGIEVIFAVRELARAENTIGVHGFQVLQAPIWLNFNKVSKPTLNYSDIILRFGFRDTAGLMGMVKAWRHLFQYTGIDMVIADYSPCALIAVRTLGLKCATLGTGFCTPPRQHPAPSMRYWVKVPEDKLLENDNIVLTNVNNVIADLGGEPLRTVSDLFKVDEEFITTFPELDHYANRGEAHYWGPGFNIDEGETLEWPEGESQRIFAYLKPDYPDFVKLLKLLSSLPARVLAYTPRIPDKLKEQHQSARMHISQKPLRLSAILSDCDLVISHAGTGTVAATLLAGIPQLLLPTQLEQRMLARRVEELSAGILVEPFDAGIGKDGKDRKAGKAPDYAGLMNNLLKKDEYRNAARAFAKKYAGFNQEQQINLMANRVEEILAG